jgi:hypothetical protein
VLTNHLPDNDGPAAGPVLETPAQPRQPPLTKAIYRSATERTLRFRNCSRVISSGFHVAMRPYLLAHGKLETFDVHSLIELLRLFGRIQTFEPDLETMSKRRETTKDTKCTNKMLIFRAPRVLRATKADTRNAASNA